MKKLSKKRQWDAAGVSTERRPEVLKEWTLVFLREDKRKADARAEAYYNSFDPAEEATRENDPHWISHQQNLGRREGKALARSMMQDRVRKAIKADDWRAVAQLTSRDPELNEWAWREKLAAPPGRRTGQARKGQQAVDWFEAEMLADLRKVAKRVREIWKVEGVTRDAALLQVSAERVAVEWLVGPEANWKPLPAKLWVGDPKARPTSWEDRCVELTDRLVNFAKSQRTKPRKRKPRQMPTARPKARL